MRATSEGAPGSPVLADLRLAPGTVRALVNPRDFDLTGTVFDRVTARAAREPDRPAVIAAGSVVGYRELVERVEEVAALLLAAGCASGAIVACHGHRSAFTPVLFLALESIGAVYLPLDPAWPAARVGEVLDLSGSAFLVDYAAAGDPVVTALAGSPGRGVVPTPVESPPRYVIYTSGTTGRPKGAIVTQAGMLNHVWAKVEDLDLADADRVAFTAPLVFDISVWQMIVPLAVGAAVVVVTDNDVLFPRRLRGLLVRHEVSVVELVPTAIGVLLDEVARQGDRPLPSLRWLISTGEELKPAQADRALAVLPHVGLLNAYGPTECSDDVTHHVVTAADTTGTRLPVGRPIGNAALYCLKHDEADGTWRATDPGEVGELFVGGVPVGLGYLGDPEATRAAFFHDVLDPDSPTGRLYRTGDLARVDERGVHYLGRVDRQVKVAGVRVELDEIEAVLSGHPAVRQCAVTLSGDERQHLTAHFVARTEVTAPELEEHLRAALPAGLVPRYWHALDALPLTPNGKVDHRALSDGAP